MYTIKAYGFKELNKATKGLVMELPKALDKDSKRIMERFKFGLQREIDAKNAYWHGPLRDSIRYHKAGKGKYVLTMREYGVYLDSMKAHWVKLENAPILQQWVNEQIPNYTGKYLLVQGKPFIRAGLERGRKEVIKTLRKGETARIFKKFFPGGFI